jgi:hypothetical protein
MDSPWPKRNAANLEGDFAKLIPAESSLQQKFDTNKTKKAHRGAAAFDNWHTEKGLSDDIWYQGCISHFHQRANKWPSRTGR